MCTAFGRRRAGALFLILGLGLVVACGGAGNGCSAVGVIGVEGVGVGIDGMAAATGAGVEGAGGVGDGDVGVDDAAAAVVAIVGNVDVVSVVAAAVVGDGVGDPGAGVVDAAVGAAAIGVVEWIRVAVHGTQGRRGVSDIRGAGSRVVEVESNRWMLGRKGAPRRVGVF